MRAADWSDKIGRTWATEWRRTDRSFAGLDSALEGAIRAAAPTDMARFVDIGCGAGKTSIAIAKACPASEVVGLDLSADLIAVADARRVEHGMAADRCRFVAGDALATAAALAPIDLFFSRHGVMFFDDPGAAFTRLAATAAPAARLVFSCFAAPADNPWAGRSATAAGAVPAPPVGGPPPPGPFAFADHHYTRSILTAAGWDATADPDRVEFRYVAGAGDDPVADAVGFFARIGPAAAALAAAPAVDRAALLDRLAGLCTDHRDGDEVAFPATAWLWSAQAKESPR